VFPIEVPPLRKRKEDIPLLADHFLQASIRKAGRSRLPLTLASVQRLQQYDWPGNVRELQHVVERAVITSSGGKLNIELPSPSRRAAVSDVPIPEVPVADRGSIQTEAQMRQFEADNIRAALKAVNGKISGPAGAAQLLGMKPTTLASRIKALGISSASPGTRDSAGPAR
jgi:transcriptional regulator with GAF, ATPase, and Fis domain